MEPSFVKLEISMEGSKSAIEAFPMKLRAQSFTFVLSRSFLLIHLQLSSS